MSLVEKSDERIVPDYNKSAAEVLQDVLKVWFRIEWHSWHCSVLLGLGLHLGLTCAEHSGRSNFVRSLDQKGGVDDMGFWHLDERQKMDLLSPTQGLKVEACWYRRGCDTSTFMCEN